MENAKIGEWYDDDKYWIKNAHGSIVGIKLDEIVTEATRRGKEEGKREAHEFYKEFIKSCQPKDPERDHHYYAQPVRTPSHRETFIQGQQTMIRILLKELSSLSQSSNEEV
jgi:hypothetical protein